MKGGSAVTSIAIIVLAIGAASYAYFVDRGRVSDLDRAARRRDVFPSFRVESVRRVELAHGAERLVLERALDAGAPWVMAEPRRDAVDAATVDALLRELEMAARLRDVQDGDAAGLDAPRVRGSVMVGPVEYRFVLGADAVAPEGAAYMRVEGEGTFVVGRSLKVQLLRGASAYRERALVPYGASDVARIEVRAQSGGDLVLERTGTSFRIGGVAGLRASGEAVEHLFGALAEARAKSFLDDAGAPPPVSESTTTVELTLRDPALPRVRLVVGGACPVDWNTPADGTREDVVVVRTEPSPLSACVDDALAGALVVDPDALADRSPFGARADEIEELRIERLDMAGIERSRVDLARRGGGWHERAPQDRDLGGGNADSANALAAAVAGARALDVRHAEPGERFLARARVTIIAHGRGGRGRRDLDARRDRRRARETARRRRRAAPCRRDRRSVRAPSDCPRRALAVAGALRSGRSDGHRRLVRSRGGAPRAARWGLDDACVRGGRPVRGRTCRLVRACEGGGLGLGDRRRRIRLRARRDPAP